MALFGIFMVNLPMIALSSSGAFIPPDDGIERTAWWVMQIGFQFKFVSLYSLLFGVGLAHFMTRATAARTTSIQTTGPSRGALLGIRRMAGLLLFGLAHGILIWSGDILVTYAILGLPFLLIVRCRAMTLAVLATVLFVASLGLSLWNALPQPSDWGFEYADATASAEVAPEYPGANDTADAPPALDFDPWFECSSELRIAEATADRAPFIHPWVILFELGIETWDPAWEAYEFRVLRDGPFIEACGLRFASLVDGNGANFDKWNWHILALFCLGAALQKFGVLGSTTGPAVPPRETPPERVWLRRAAWLVIPGLILESTYAASITAESGALVDWFAWMGPIHSIGAVLMMLGIVGALCRIQEASRRVSQLATPCRAVGRIGRMGLTGYIAENAVGAFLMYSWGLAWLGEVSRLQLVGLALVIWLALTVGAHFWFDRFSMGPLEWLWRVMTYGRIRSSPREASIGT